MVRPNRRRLARSFRVSFGPPVNTGVDAGLIVAVTSAVSVGDGDGATPVPESACFSRRTKQ